MDITKVILYAVMIASIAGGVIYNKPALIIIGVFTLVTIYMYINGCFSCIKEIFMKGTNREVKILILILVILLLYFVAQFGYLAWKMST